MKRAVVIASFLALTSAWRSSGMPVEDTADQKFEKLLTLAMKDVEKADWRALRRAFAATTHYQPYNVDVDKRLREIAKAIGGAS